MLAKILITIMLITVNTVLWANDEFYSINNTNSKWEFYQTDNPNLNYSEIPDNKWFEVKPSRLLNTKNKDGLYGWYKITFDWKETSNTPQMFYIQSIRYDDETWLNDQKIGGEGHSYKQWDFLSTNPHNMPRKYDVPRQLLRPKHNTLMIKVSLGFGETFGAMQPGGVGIGGDIIGFGTPELVTEYYNQQVLKNSIIDTVIIVLGLVDLFIIIVLFRKSIHHFHEFWALLISSLVLFLSVFFLDIFYILNVRPDGTDLLMMTSMILGPLTIGLYFWSFYKNIPKGYVLLIGLIWLSLYFIILIPFTFITPEIKIGIWNLWVGCSTAVFVYCLISAVNGIRNKSSGALWQLFGLITYYLLIRTQWLPNDLFEHRNIIIGSLILRYSLLFSYFRRISQMSKNYKALSSRMLVTIEKNRQEMARELHDNLGQHLAAAKLQLLLYNQGHTKKAIGFIKEEIYASIQSVRELIEGLHPLVLDQNGFENAVIKECHRLEKLYEVHITSQIEVKEVELSSEIEKHLYRIIQEALNNAIKNGKAENISINVTQRNKQLTCVIEDNGIGIGSKKQRSDKQPKFSTGFGLVSLKERVSILDGNIIISTISNNKKTNKKGTRITVRLPLYYP